MYDKTLNQEAQDLLSLIRDLDAGNGAVERGHLSVVGRGRGLEVARPLTKLKSLGLVEEYEQKPFFLLRMFGASAKEMVRLTEAGRGAEPVLIEEPVPAPAQDPCPEAETAAILPLPELDLPDISTLDQAKASEPVFDVPLSQILPLTPPPLQVVDLLTEQRKARISEAVAAAVEANRPKPAVVAEPVVVAQEPLAQVEKSSPEPVSDLGAEAANPQTPIAAPIELAVEVAVEVAVEPIEQTLPQAALEPVPEVVASQETQALAEPEAPAVGETANQPRVIPRQTMSAGRLGYTDEAGGAPVAADPVAMPFADPELVESLTEVLSVMGMELTVAGEALICDRVAKGASASEALLQVVVFAFAHAARYDALSERPAESSDLAEYAQDVLRELGKLQDAGDMTADHFNAQREVILALADNTTDRTSRVDDLFTDPIGGAAPPALLPEDLRGLIEIELEDAPQV